jgi:hypothetical protein
MSTAAATIPNPVPEPTLRDLAHQAACDAKLNSFANAYARDPSKAALIATTFSKTFPADARLAKLCDNRLVNQMAFLMEVPGRAAQLTVLSCPFPTTKGDEAVFAGSLGDSLDVICPVTIRMRDVKGNVVTVAAVRSIPTSLNLAISTTDPLSEEAPPAADEEDAVIVAIPPGPDRIHIEISDPTDTPCIVLLPKIFPLSGGYGIPNETPLDINDLVDLKTIPGMPNLDEFHHWLECMKYGVVHLKNYSMHDTDTLFEFANIDSTQFHPPEANMVKRFTIAVNFLTPADQLYSSVITAVRASKEKALVDFGSKLTPRVQFTTPTKATGEPTSTPSVTPPNEDRYTAALNRMASAIIDQPAHAKTSTEREHDKEAKDHQHFYELLFASTPTVTNADDGTKEQQFIPAKLNREFIKVLKANTNSKATRLLQAVIEEVASEMNFTDNRFASASELKAELFDQPTTAAIRTANWEHKHTVLHPEGIKTHFAFHHLAPPRTWAAEYKTRMEGAMKITQQEQVGEASSRTLAKTTDLYHHGRMGSLADINGNIGNFFCLMNAIIQYDASNPPAVWLEIVEFDTTMRSAQARQWFEIHRNMKELMFNVAQEITSTIAGFVAVARNAKYKQAHEDGTPISPQIFAFAKQQGSTLRTNLQGTIVTMQAGPYKEAALTFKLFQPPEPAKKRAAQGETGTESPQSKQKTNGGTTTNNRTTKNPNTGNQTNRSATATQSTGQPGKKIFKNLSTDDTARLLHPGPIFPHPTKPNKFTLLCCRAAYEGKTCTYPTCMFFHFPENLADAVSEETKNKMVAWVKTQPNVEWLPEAATWASPAGNSTTQ